MNDKEGCWKFYPHTADAKFRAFGKTVEEMFCNAGVACFEVITETDKIDSGMFFPIRVQAKNYEALLFDFLDELLFLLDTEGFVLAKIDGLTIKKEGDLFTLDGQAVGDEYKKYDVSCNVKAVTYNDMYIKTPEETGKTWECQVVVDL